MPATDINFQAHAENIAADFFGKGIPLADGVVKTAKEHEFTPEEVKRLVEKTNTAASIHLLKTAEDRKATFTLANLELVLQRTHPADREAIQKVAVYTGIPETRLSKQNQPGEKIAKLAGEAVASCDKSSVSLEEIEFPRAMATIATEIESRKLEKIGLELSTQKKINNLCRDFIQRNGSDFQKYAADCEALFGEKAQSMLDAIAGYLRTPLEKTASCDQAFIDDTASNIQAMSEICSGLERLVKLGAEVEQLERIHAGLIAQAKKAALQ